jgi:hypothetical protein
MTKNPEGTSHKDSDSFCPECNCHKALHIEEGCICGDNGGHPETLVCIDEDCYCACQRYFPKEG